MNIRYRPPLQHIASVRIALGILHTFNLQAIKSDFLTSKGDVSEEYSSKLISKITFLGDKEQEKKISGIIRALVWELLRWMFSHDEIVYSNEIDFYDIYWYSYGVIDRFETAQTLIRKESIDITRRFVLACKYYFKDHAQTLWKNLTEFDQLVLGQDYGSVKSMWFWIDESHTDDITIFIQMYQGHSTKIEEFTENYLGLRCYFPSLGPEARYRCLSYGLLEGEIHHFDLYLCFAALTIDEAKDLFRHLSASNRLRVMELFLYWPLQFIFVEVLDQLWSLTSHYNFRNIFKFILEERIDKNWEDADYAQLVQNIWARCPVSYKKSLGKDRIYAKVELLFTKKC
ncbi:uncharacterized protein TNIN_477431 [Trichonephila inaurata madagascariensis]|uniref:Uncharacterized protein n=1 Tax=Trichonephila inaurata madagascariensis TaxID=2747483 RepID=A0A8X6XZS7_9ARAC|nr:uncharacterized protein TNIN_477431 [Trichonephila inaurata madagascariensis]